MKLGMKEHVDVATGVQDEIKIAFEANAVAFYAQISGLAKDKKRYPIRELSTNAWDASRGDFEVHLPTRLNPVFRVRDYGPGMSHDQMVNVYARLYASTKRDTNNQVGGWGLGSKSPFAYLIEDTGAGSYNVTSYHDGVMRAYVLSLSQDGSPVMRKLAEAPTTERNGLDVSFAVRRDDIADFHEGAKDILWSFLPRPQIFPQISWKEPVVESQGENWTKYKSSTVPFYGPRVRMGCVMYPFDLNQIENGGFLDYDDEVLFDAPIGSLKVTLSREELAYDDTTRTTLKSLVAQYENNFLEQLRAKIDAAGTLFEAAHIFEEETDTLGHTRQDRLRASVRWQGHYISSTLGKENCKMDTLPEGWSQFEKFEDTTVRTKWASDATIVIEHNPSYSLSRFHMAELVGKKVLWVRCKRIVRDQVLNALGNPEVIDLDSFKVPMTKRVSKTIRKRKTLMVTSGGRIQRLTQDVDLSEGGLMVETYPHHGYRRRGGNDFYRLHSDQGTSISFSDTESFIMTCFEFGLVEVGTVLLVKAHDQEVAGDWSMFADDMIDAIRDKVDVSEFTGLHKKTINNLNHNLQEVAKMKVFSRAPESVRNFQTDLKALYRALEGNDTSSTVSDKAFAALKRIGVDVNKPDVSCPIAAMHKRYEDLCGQYLLLKSIVEQHYYGYNQRLEKGEKLEHYFELLSRPVVANDNEDVEDDDIDLDEAA
jgi:hypothetical protein